MSSLRVACVQITAGRDVPANIAVASALIREAAAKGARLIATPEMTSLMERNRREMRPKVRTEDEDIALAAFRALAAELGAHLLIGSLPIDIGDARLANRGFLIGPDGAIEARYDKIHMFDVDLPQGESFRESNAYRPGESAVVVPVEGAMLGLSICYDLRFAALYRRLAQAGAEILAVPAAFTRVTGEAHWHILLRARAIETACFVIAPGQTGTHEDGRQTYGHSLIVDPWGHVLADGGTDVGIITADLDLDAVKAARGRIPALQHDRVFAGP
ncbi:carbon-nitrogen hydrolase family protein [Zavarzinia compransoris]|uniref:carbon-nitrogen hydrolase family protein n=1 Tax=Zavarzinia marina TaxID=2911065 RepID=UPI001F233D6C|nr:carbon-nitrogen hydrolase family protein [Zavarzinia marina]MCF4167042.1 carbon-nitrogen hydrolase family protein [Zavarzinia marina]